MAAATVSTKTTTTTTTASLVVESESSRSSPVEEKRSFFSSLINEVDDAISKRNHDERHFELIVLGASGYMGRTVCLYLAHHAPKSLKWAIAGRNASKLASIHDQVAAIAPHFKGLAVVEVDAKQEATLNSMATRTGLVLNAAAPYGELGIEVIKACVNAKTDYIDLSSENVFTRKVIESFHEKAREEGVLVVPACGFYSVPADLGAYVLTKHIRHKYHRETKRIKGTVDTSREVLSRGAVYSILDAARSFMSTLRQLMDPYYLVTGSGPRPTNVRDLFIPIYYDDEFEGAQGYYIGSAGNEQIVRRSNQVKEYKYGEKFTYTETRTYSGRISAFFHTITELNMSAALLFPPFRWFMRLVWPRWAGEPAAKKLQGGHWSMKFVARVHHEHKSDKEKIPEYVKALISDDVDPRINGSAKLISEAALQIVADRFKLPGRKGGVLTPASAFGSPLVERLRKAGMTIEVGSDAW